MNKNLCLECGKSAVNNGICSFDESMKSEGKMSYCPTFIRPKINRTKPLCSSPFKVLVTYNKFKN